MAVEYNPQDAVTCWPVVEGGKPIDYDAELNKVEEATSKTSGNPMEVWTWKVFAPDGRSQLIDDYVVIPAAVWKIKQLARALNREKEFNAAKFHAEDYIGSGVTVELLIEKQTGYDDKNKIGKVKAATVPDSQAQAERAAPYPRTRQTVASGVRPQSPISEEQQFKEDDIPF